MRDKKNSSESSSQIATSYPQQRGWKPTGGLDTSQTCTGRPALPQHGSFGGGLPPPKLFHINCFTIQLAYGYWSYEVKLIYWTMFNRNLNMFYHVFLCHLIDFCSHWFHVVTVCAHKCVCLCVNPSSQWVAVKCWVHRDYLVTVNVALSGSSHCFRYQGGKCMFVREPKPGIDFHAMSFLSPGSSSVILSISSSRYP